MHILYAIVELLLAIVLAIPKFKNVKTSKTLAWLIGIGFGVFLGMILHNFVHQFVVFQTYPITTKIFLLAVCWPLVMMLLFNLRKLLGYSRFFIILLSCTVLFLCLADSYLLYLDTAKYFVSSGI